MIWIFLLVLAAGLILAMWKLAGADRGVIQLSAAFLCLGLAGYAWQGWPGLAGSPTEPRVERRQPDSSFAIEREQLLKKFGSTAQVLDAADAMHRAGLERYGIGLLQGGITRNPEDPELWVGLGNALTLYADGVVTPAADLAFARATKLSPDHPAPPYFRALAYAQAGDLDSAGEIWRELLAKTPENAPWRPNIEARLKQLDAAVQR